MTKAPVPLGGTEAEALLAEDARSVGGTTAPAGAPPPEAGHVTRQQLARVIGKDERTIRRWEQTRLAPALSVGPDGVHRFDVQRVRELIEIRERHGPATPEAYDAETAAEVFALFADGIDPVEVVMRMNIHPLAVDALRRQWAALRGGFLVSAEIARRISSLRGCPILDADGLLKALLEPRPNTRCTECHREFIDGEALCAGCSRRLSFEQAHRREAQVATEKARREQRKAEQKAEEEYEKRIAQMDREIAERRQRRREHG